MRRSDIARFLRRPPLRLARRALPAAGVALVLALARVPGAAGQPPDTEARIREARALSNAALAAADLDAFMASIDEDYVGTAGNGGHVRSRSELAGVIGGIFGTTPGVHFVRTPLVIEADSASGRAVETGRWVRLERVGGAPVRTGVGGRYTAYWRRAGDRWLIHAEIFVTLPASPASGAPPAPGTCAADPAEAVAAVRRAYMEAFDAGRIDDVVALHAEDVVSMPAGYPPLVGREPLRELMAESFRTAPPGFRFAFEALEVRFAGAWAVERGVTRAWMDGADRGVPGGKYVLLHQRGGDGCWRIAWSITNGDRPPDPG